MPTLFGTRLGRRGLLSRVGDPSQVAGIRRMQLQDGRETGVRIADVRTGSGLRFQVSFDRGMDISMAEYKGMPIAWRSSNGDVHPAYFDPRGAGWARSFAGGLLTGCGLTYLGAPCTDLGEELGQHGRLSNLPAYDIDTGCEWRGDEYVMRLRGQVREMTRSGDCLHLRRTIETWLGSSWLMITDVVRNEGMRQVPIMILYHINAGWPLVDRDAKLYMNATATVPRDGEAGKGLEKAAQFSDPVSDFREQVFYHELRTEADGFASVLLLNGQRSLGLAVRYRQRELPRFVEWKMMGEKMYVVGLEPANCGVEGRAHERTAGTLQFMEPGDEKEFVVMIGVLEGEEQVTQFIHSSALR